MAVCRLVLTAGVSMLLAVAGCGGNAEPSAQPNSGAGATAATASDAPSPSDTAPASPSPTAPAPTARFEVHSRKLVAGPRTVEVKLGTDVVLEVVTDAADELHVHGYEKKVQVAPGSPTRVGFAATIPGVFEVELHSGVKLCDLRVR